MSAAVMSNYFFVPFGQRFVADPSAPPQNWMFAHMAQYPPPPQPEQQHYNAMYPANPGAQQLLDAQDQLHYGDLSQAIYPKLVPNTTAQASSRHQAQHLAQQLQQHASLDDSQPHSPALPLQQQPHSGQQSNNPHTSQHSSQQGTPDQNAKSNRLRKACDSCSIRKVKCDESGPPCRACTALDIPCTFERPSRRRGPPNRHAEAIKRRRLEDTGDSTQLHEDSDPSSPTHAAEALAALSSRTPSQSATAESICPVETLDLLIDDFFTYMHPLYPFPHEPSFREAWKRREDLTNSSFLALLASMVGALVSSFPRKPRLHLKAQKRATDFPNHPAIVSRCRAVCTQARGPAYLDNDNLSVYDAATSFFLGLTGLYTFRWRAARLYYGECFTIVRALGLHKASEQSHTRLGSLPASVGAQYTDHEGSREQALDNITFEMGRRIFWTLFVSIRSMQQLGAAFGELNMPPPTSTDPYPPLPSEVDDFCIYPDRTDPQPAEYTSLIANFNANARIHSSYNASVTTELAWGAGVVFDWDRQSRVLQESLKRCKQSVGEILSEVNSYRSAPEQNGRTSSSLRFAQPQMPKDPASSLTAPSHHHSAEQDPEQRRLTQHEIQRGNILASNLWTRSYIVEKYWTLREALDETRLPKGNSSRTRDTIEQEMRQERENIVRDLLSALSNISEVNMEPNADNFTNKIRALASALLELPDHRKGQLASQAAVPLASFLQTLSKLERSDEVDGDLDQTGQSNAERNEWAALREYQTRLARLVGLA